jgi:hypothetical protein
MSMFGAASGLFSSWSAKADLEDAFNVAIDQATIAALATLAPNMVSLYRHDALPPPFERQVDRAITGAHWVAEQSGEDEYLAAYAEAIGPLIAVAVETIR